MTIVFGTKANDALIGSLDDDIISGGIGDDAIFGGAGDDHRSGFQFKDPSLLPPADADVWYSTTQFGDYRAIRGGLYGGAGNDFISGGGGDDWIEGQAGSDTLSGGQGADTFAYRFPVLDDDGVDRVLDFSREHGDKIEIASLGFDTHFVKVKSHEVGQVWFKNGVVKYDDDGDNKADLRIAMDGVNKMAAGDFILDL